METKANIGIGGSPLAGHKTGKEVEANFQETRIGDSVACPERSECGDCVPFGQATVNEEGCTGSVRLERDACGYSKC